MLMAVIQLVSTTSVTDNLAVIEQQLQHLRSQSTTSSEPLLAVLPECCLLFGGSDQLWKEHAEAMGDGPMQQQLSQLASRYQCYLVAGTLPLKTADGRAAAASLLFDPQGEQLARYDKIHLFDVEVTDGQGSYRESLNTCPGNQVTVVDTPFGRLGMAVCYDLRFSALFRQLRALGAELISLPSAFTAVTGEAHWEVLLRARAIENQCYLLASNQGGTHDNGRVTWGHSMIVDPWGLVVAEANTGVGYASCRPDGELIKKVRARMPMASQEQFLLASLPSASENAE